MGKAAASGGWQVLLLVLGAVALGAQGRSPAAPPPAPPDAVLATVDGAEIRVADVDLALALAELEAAAEETPRALRRRVLDRLIEERLRRHELESFGLDELPVEEVEAGVEELRERLGGEAGLAKTMAAHGIDAAALRGRVAERLRVRLFVEERLGERAFVGMERVRAHYDEVLVPEARRRGRTLPAVESMRAEIRATLRDALLAEETARWTAELRLAAEIEDRFDLVYPPPE